MSNLFAGCIAACILFGAATLRAEAMPVFAEAYGYDCQKCHIQVPALNSYGRYVQRTMYAALDRETLKATAPVWIGEQPFSDSKDPNLPHRTQFGNVAVHVAGFLSPELTTHIQQWLVQNDKPGGVDSAWFSYNNVLGAKNTHLVVGKMPPPGPSYFSQWMDLASFAAPQTTIGERASALSSNRWGMKAGWSTTRFTADVGWFGASGDLNGATDFSSTTDKAIQWNVAYAPYDRPFQLGVYGNRGTFPLSVGGVDQYAATGVYVQLDQTRHAPGVLLTFQRSWDGNAGADPTTGTALGPAASSGGAVEVFYQPLRHYEGLISVRHESTSDGFGTVTHTNNIDLNFRLARFVHATVEQYTQSLQKPGFRYQVWWTTPIQRAH